MAVTHTYTFFVCDRAEGMRWAWQLVATTSAAAATMAVVAVAAAAAAVAVIVAIAVAPPVDTVGWEGGSGYGSLCNVNKSRYPFC